MAVSRSKSFKESIFVDGFYFKVEPTYLKRSFNKYGRQWTPPMRHTAWHFIKPNTIAFSRQVGLEGICGTVTMPDSIITVLYERPPLRDICRTCAKRIIVCQVCDDH